MQKRPFFTQKRPFLCCKMTQFDDQITANASADKVAYHVPQFLFLGSLAKDLLFLEPIDNFCIIAVRRW